MRKKIQSLFKIINCFLILTLICGVIYPVLMFGVGQLLFHDQVNGNLITTKVNGKQQVIGSKFLGQVWKNPKYLIGRPDQGSPSNLSPVSKEQKDLVENRIRWWNEFDPNSVGKNIPMDLVTASASGVDPDISKEAAYFQISRIAQHQNVSEKIIKNIIDANIQNRDFGILGEQRVNVLLVNKELSKLNN